MALHFLSFSLQGKKGGKKGPEKKSGIMKSNNSNKTSKHKGAFLYTSEWEEGVERNLGVVKEIAQLQLWFLEMLVFQQCVSGDLKSDT